MNRRQQVLSWWQGRERREQWMLAVMGACLLAFLYWYALMLPLRALRERLASGAWAEALQKLPGYGVNRPGEVLSLTQALPWWRYAKPKS